MAEATRDAATAAERRREPDEGRPPIAADDRCGRTSSSSAACRAAARRPRQAVRGPRLHRRRQPAGRAPARPRQLVASDPSASRWTRSCSTCAPATRRSACRRDARRARGARHPAAGVLPRGERRDPHPALLARRATATRSTTTRGIASSIARERRAARPRPRSEADVIIDTSELSLRQLRERLFARLGDVPEPNGASRSSSSASASSTASRSRPTSSSTCASCRTRTTCRSCGRSPGSTEPVRDFVLGQPTRRSSSTARAASSSCSIPAYASEGKSRLTVAHRLHRRLPPLDRRSPRSSRAWLRERARAGRGLPPRARAGVNLRALALPPGIGVKRWLLLVFLGLLVAGPRRGARRCARSTQDLEPDGVARRRCVDARHAAVPALRAARPDPRRRSASALFGVGAYRVVRALIDPFAR